MLPPGRRQFMLIIGEKGLTALAKHRKTDLMQEFTELMDSIATKTSRHASETALALAQKEWDRSIRKFVTKTNDNMQTLNTLLDCSEEYRNKVKVDLDAANELIRSLRYSIFEIQSAKNLKELEVLSQELRKWEEIFAQFTISIQPAAESLNKTTRDLAEHMRNLDDLNERIHKLESQIGDHVKDFKETQTAAVAAVQQALDGAIVRMEEKQYRHYVALEGQLSNWEKARKVSIFVQWAILIGVILNLLL